MRNGNFKVKNRSIALKPSINYIKNLCSNDLTLTLRKLCSV